jgi:hypothetical protein
VARAPSPAAVDFHWGGATRPFVLRRDGSEIRLPVALHYCPTSYGHVRFPLTAISGRATLLALPMQGINRSLPTFKEGRTSL